jgi:hypothetical protein
MNDNVNALPAGDPHRPLGDPVHYIKQLLRWTKLQLLEAISRTSEVGGQRAEDGEMRFFMILWTL